MQTALIIAKYIINQCIKDGSPISNLRLQYLLYLVQKNTLKTHDKPAFYDNFVADITGPKVPNVYYAFCHYGAMEIIPYQLYSLPPIKNASYISSILKEYQSESTFSLMEKCKDKAWEEAHKSASSIISFDAIRQA